MRESCRRLFAVDVVCRGSTVQGCVRCRRTRQSLPLKPQSRGLYQTLSCKLQLYHSAVHSPVRFASRSSWTEELGPHRKSTSRNESGCHTFRHRNLPAAEDLATRLSVGRAPRLSRYNHATPAYPDPNCLGRSTSVISQNRPRPSILCLLGRIRCNRRKVRVYAMTHQ